MAGVSFIGARSRTDIHRQSRLLRILSPLGREIHRNAGIPNCHLQANLTKR